MNNNTTLHIDPLPFLPSTKLPFIIAGPCSAETQEQVLCTAKQLKKRWFYVVFVQVFGNQELNPEALKVMEKRLCHG